MSKIETLPRNIGRQERSKETIKIIIQAARLLLIEQGPKAFNTNKIAKRAGVSIGSLYQYFPNKNSICSYFFNFYFQDQIDMVLRNLETIQYPEDIKRVVAKIIDELFIYRKNEDIITRSTALMISEGLFNDQLIEKKAELSEKVLEVLHSRLGVIKNKTNLIKINLLVESIDAMIFKINDVSSDQEAEDQEELKRFATQFISDAFDSMIPFQEICAN
jgi:AcrR family transcriptional regulator